MKALDLPLFLHERNCSDDFIQVFNELDPEHKLRGCVHSFTGTADTAKKLLDLGFYIGFNGSGMRTEESLNVIRSVPLERILIETGIRYYLRIMCRWSLLWNYFGACIISICKNKIRE